jgi:hypothetical protein
MQHCSRCKRPAPDELSVEFLDWEAESDGTTVICPGCLTLGEENAIADDMLATEEAARELEAEDAVVDQLEQHFPTAAPASATFSEIVIAAKAAQRRAEAQMAEVERLKRLDPNPATGKEWEAAMAQVKIEMDLWRELIDRLGPSQAGA